MSRIDELLAKHCPDGIEFFSIGDLAETVAGLSGKTKSDFAGGSARFVSYKNAFANLAVNQQALDFVAIRPGERQNRLRQGDIVITGSSESLDEVGLSSVVTSEPIKPLYLNSFCFALRLKNPSILLPDFSKYLFRSGTIRKQIKATANGVTRINISKGRFLKVRIPIPPLEVQREIVRVLERFSRFETELRTELEAEREARRRHYEHYQQHLFLNLDPAGVRRLPLRDVGKWYGGGTPSKTRADYWERGTIPWISPKDMRGLQIESTEDYITEAAVAASATKMVPKNSVALVVRSSILDRTLPIAFVPVPASLNQDMKAVVAGPGIMPKYLFHVLRAERANLLRNARRSGGSVGSLESGKLWKFEVPVPEVSEQERLVILLDKFDELVNDLNISIPAELSARRKQYEYYRDQLLTFQDAVV